MTRILLALLASLVLAATPIDSAPQAPKGLPLRLGPYLANTVKLTPSERSQLDAGAPVTKRLPADDSIEVSVFGAVWIKAPLSRYVTLVKDIETFERGGGFVVTRRISSPPRLEDFAKLRLPKEDVEDLRNCRVGDCIVKLGEAAVERFRTEINWDSGNPQAAADRLMRQLALEYATGYLHGGNERLAVYRDNSRPTFVAKEFRDMVDQMPELTTHMPDVRRYLLEYPKATMPDATSFLYWQETQFGLRPTIRINHLIVRQSRDGAVIASKMLYASHYFWTGIELRVLLPDSARGEGFWLVTVSRSRSDGLGGFTGMLIRRKVHGEVRDGALAALKATKKKLEGPLGP